MPSVFKIAGRNGKRSARYYGKVRVRPGIWRRVPLTAAKRASDRRLRELQGQADQRRVGLPKIFRISHLIGSESLSTNTSRP
jgi:hypothetical protein